MLLYDGRMVFCKKALRLTASLFFAATVLFTLYGSFILYLDGRTHLHTIIPISLGVFVSAVVNSLLYVLSSTNITQKQRDTRTALWALFGFYCMMLLSALFLSRIHFGAYTEQRFVYQSNMDLMTNFIPLKTIRLYARCLRYNYIGPIIPLINLLGNLLLFMPMAFFLPCLFPPMRVFWKYAVSLAVLLVIIEGLQFVLCCGSCDVDDVILNLSGSLAVYLLLRLPFIQTKINAFCVFFADS